MKINNTELDNIHCSDLSDDLGSYDISYKFIMIGDTGVGKSCLMLRGTKNEFKEDDAATGGGNVLPVFR